MSKPVTIREIEGKEAAEIGNWLGSYAFMPSPPIGKLEDATKRVEKSIGTRHYAAFEKDKAVARFVTIPMTQNVRGQLYPMAGIAGVASHPAARRKGYIRQLANVVFEADYEAGRVFSTLYPFKESFYENMGYVTFPAAIEATLRIDALLPLVKQGYGEDIELGRYTEDYRTYHQFLQQQQTHQHGMAHYAHYPAPNPEGDDAWIAFAKNGEAIEGLLLYKLTGEALELTFTGYRFYATTPEARYRLLGWIGRHVDQTSKVTLRVPGDQRPGTWLANLATGLAQHDLAPMGRVLNVAKMEGMSVGEGAFSARITDPQCPWNEGIWHFTGHEGRLQVTTSQQADCTLTIQGLSALVYGVNDPDIFALRNWGDPDTATQTRMRSLFPPAYPHLHESF